MQLFIQSDSTRCVTVSDTTTLLSLKHQLSTLLPVEEQVLTYAGESVSDDTILTTLPANSTLVLSGKLLGGKVHGSLARAGKVKGQTPKVAAQEDKKKKKTGRCKRRIQYNQRFNANAAAFGGRKKGPNSNAA